MIYKIVGGTTQQQDFVAGAIRDRLIMNQCGCSIIRETDGADRKAQIEKLLVTGVGTFTLPLTDNDWKEFPTLVLIGEVWEEIEEACPGVLDFLGDDSVTLTVTG